VKTHQTISVVVIVLYLVITSAIGLFHNEGCLLGASNEDTTKGLSSGESCPACMFSVSFNSSKVDHELSLLDVENPIICQPEWHFTVIDHHEWSYSILLRAPPTTSIS
jgi:hypothetical protein